MANNIQTSTLSLTLPISCQICLGKVKQPVICANHHVFCSLCMEMWLKKASQCPSCRVPITEESPCREIIGGTNESDHRDNPSTRKCLRKTRAELLLREYEEEIEGLIRENDELKAKSQSLGSQLRTALDPCSINTERTVDQKVDPCVIEEWTNKLRAATDICDKVTQDMDKLKEANKALRSQNVDLVQENMRLKAEVASRSPQKFGRYTVAALEAKIQQYDRDVDHLKRALERSDQYIDELEARVNQTDRVGLEVPEASGCGNTQAGSEALSQQQKINMMMRSLSDNERKSICSNPEAQERTFSRHHSLKFMPSPDSKDPEQNLTDELENKFLASASSDLLPTTPSTAFRSLTLRSPGIREKKVSFKPVSYLRKLDFEDFASPGSSGSGSSVMEDQFRSLDGLPKGLPLQDEEPSKSVLWGGWQGPTSIVDQASCPGPSTESSVESATSANLLGETNSGFQQISSEASMDAAYLDKISELDSMMLDGESSSSRGSQLSHGPSPTTDMDKTIVSDQTCLEVKSAMQSEQQVQSPSPSENMEGNLIDKEAPSSSEESCAALDAGESGAIVPGRAAPSQTDEMSFDLLFDSLEEDKAGPTGSVSPVSQDQDHTSPSSGGTSKPVNTRDRSAVNISQPTKRKSHSPFNTSSPTKLSKLM